MSATTASIGCAIESCFHVLARRDLAVRYKQTVVGVAWALIRAFLTMVIIFGQAAKLPSDGTASSVSMGPGQ